MNALPKLDHLDLANLRKRFPKDFTPDQVAKGQTAFLKRLSISAHRFYGGKIVTVPKAPVYDLGWFGVWYTPGVSAVSTTIRDHHLESMELSNRGNLVAIVSDGTRVLGDGDCTPAGGLGVMEGKAFLMYYLGGVSGMALCINSHVGEKVHVPNAFDHAKRHEHSAEKIIDFVRMLAPSVGAVNLEDIAQPNCFAVLDGLQDCGIPVWHDDAQGTACVTLAGMINAVKVVGKKLKDIKCVFYGAGASNSTIVRLLLAEGLDPAKVIVADSKGCLHTGRKDVEADTRFYRKWEICRQTNPQRIDSFAEAIKGADAVVALSTPGPDVIKPEWVRSMAKDAIVFACANPVPEIYPHVAKECGAAVVATGRSDFPNQVNNSLCFPGLLKGALLVRASRITDRMAIMAARTIAERQVERGLHADCIVPDMEDVELAPRVAAAVARQAVEEGVAQAPMAQTEAYQLAQRDIAEARRTVKVMMEQGIIAPPPKELIDEALAAAVNDVRTKSAMTEAGEAN